MRPYEETWSAKEVVVARDDGQWIARFSPSPGESPDVEAARAKLAAQAPAMARMLHKIICHVAPGSLGATFGHDEYHEVQAVLRVAGALVEPAFIVGDRVTAIGTWSLADPGPHTVYEVRESDGFLRITREAAPSPKAYYLNPVAAQKASDT